MTDLATRRCEPCRSDSPALGADQWPALLAALPAWRIQQADSVPVLSRMFRFADFAAALAFACAVGALAEAADHHPRLVVEWGRVEVSWWTHAIGGLHLNDFILAARCDLIGAAG